MLVFRITHKDFSDKLFASGLPGRWNGENKKVIYCAETIALALLENMVRRQGVGFNRDFKIMIIEFPASLKLLLLKGQILLKDGEILEIILYANL